MKYIYTRLFIRLQKHGLDIDKYVYIGFTYLQCISTFLYVWTQVHLHTAFTTECGACAQNVVCMCFLCVYTLSMLRYAHTFRYTCILHDIIFSLSVLCLSYVYQYG